MNRIDFEALVLTATVVGIGAFFVWIFSVIGAPKDVLLRTPGRTVELHGCTTANVEAAKGWRGPTEMIMTCKDGGAP